MSRADHGTLDLCKSQKCGKKRSILVQIGYGMMSVRRRVINRHIMHGRVLSPSQEKNIVGYSAVKNIYIPW